MTTSWKKVFGALDDLVPLAVDVLRRLDAKKPGVHSQASIKNDLASRLAAKYPENSAAATLEYVQNIMAHMQSQWSKKAGLGDKAKDTQCPDPIMFAPPWLADFSSEWGRRPGIGDKWDVFRRPGASDFAGLLKPTSDAQELEERTAKLVEYPLGKPPGELTPKKVIGSPQGAYERRPEVRAWILRESHGKCECCQGAAPFNRPDGSPYLEVHHAVPLAAGGPDTVDNAIAVCPNCHRRLHHGHDRAETLSQVYQQVGRLVSPEDKGPGRVLFPANE